MGWIVGLLAISVALISGYVVSRRFRVYAQLLGKHEDRQDIHNKEQGSDAETAEASPAAPNELQVLVSHCSSPRHSA